MKNKIIKFLNKQFRFVIIDGESLEEKKTVKLSRINFYMISVFLGLCFFVVSFIIIVYSPINQYLPGKSSDLVQNKLISLSLKSDSLERALYIRSLYLDNMNAIINGDSSVLSFSQETSKISLEKDLIFSPSKEDSVLREKVEREDLGSINKGLKKETTYFLFYPPLEGIISDSFNLLNNHYAVDLVAKEGAKIKSISEGTVILSDWNPKTGHVIGIQHKNNFISFYKHCSRLLKKTGDVVELGEHIAIIGNSGELSTGPHLHLELWQNGIPMDPENFIVF
mgnify:CR=1 FL=1